jgi:uncharacterized membrane protein
MTLIEQRGGQAPMEAEASRPGAMRQGNGASRQAVQERQPVNVGGKERLVSIASGSVLALFGLERRSIPGLLAAGIGGMMVYRGATGHCPMYDAMGVDTAHEQGQPGGRGAEDEIAEHGIHVEQSFLINRPAEELYRFWRNFENLPRFLTHIERIEVQGDRRSHWVARLSRMVGGHLEWDAEITADEPNSRLAWRSLPGSEIDTTGEVRFSKALGDRGTEMHVFMNFVPPFGAVAGMFPTLFNKATRRMMRTDLGRFKALMEVGEILTVDGQPRGNCLSGGGSRYHES